MGQRLVCTKVEIRIFEHWKEKEKKTDMKDLKQYFRIDEECYNKPFEIVIPY